MPSPLTLWYSLLFSHSRSFSIDLLIYRMTATLDRNHQLSNKYASAVMWIRNNKGGWGLSHPLAEADDWPQTEAQCTATAEAATEEPPHINWQGLPQAAVYTADTGFEFFRCHLKKCTFKIKVKAVVWSRTKLKDVDFSLSRLTSCCWNIHPPRPTPFIHTVNCRVFWVRLSQGRSLC